MKKSGTDFHEIHRIKAYVYLLRKHSIIYLFQQYQILIFHNLNILDIFFIGFHSNKTNFEPQKQETTHQFFFVNQSIYQMIIDSTPNFLPHKIHVFKHMLKL